jgi:hypothetical protein
VADGTLCRLNERDNRWDRVAATTPRIVHRLAPLGEDQILVIGGAVNGDNLDLIEAVTVPSPAAAAAAAEAVAD